jgi:hydrogenase nickel incorporation protein HypA/HybF
LNEPFIILNHNPVNTHRVIVNRTVWVVRTVSILDAHTLHELSLTQNLIEIAEDHARRENATVITSVTIEIGSLSGVMPEAMEFAFEACTKDTLADGATLEIRHIPALGRCQKCGQECAMESLLDGCSACDSYALDILKGQEMALIEMEID